MSFDDPLTQTVSIEPNQLLKELLAPLATISNRTDLLQRVTMVTPGLTDLERTVLLEGLEATKAAAQQLATLLEPFITMAASVESPPGQIAGLDPTAKPTK